MRKTFQGRTKTKKVRFDGFSVAKEGNGRLFAPVSYGCDCHGGVLRRGMGVEPYLKEDGSEILVAINGNVESAFFTQFVDSSGGGSQRLLLGDNYGYLYAIDSKTGRTFFRYDIGDSFSHCAVRTEEEKYIHFFAGSSKVVYTSDASRFTICTTDPVFGCCILGGRCFIGIESRKIRYSAPYAFDIFEGDSNSGGMLYLPDGVGEILSLQTDGKYLYAFMEKEIYRVTVGADGMDFSLEELEYFGGDICAKSMLVTEKGIVFLSMSGVYLLRGKKAEQICKHLSIRPIEAKRLCAVGRCEDLALIDYKTKGMDGGEFTQRLALSMENNDGYFCEREGMLGGNDLCVIGGVLHKFVKDSPKAVYPTAPCFKTGRLDFGTSARKTLKALCLEGKGKVRVYIQGDGKAYAYVFHLDGGESKVKMLLSGNSFDVRMYPSAETEVRSMQVEYSYMEG